MRIRSISGPIKGSRGGLAMMGSITFVGDNHNTIWVRVDSPRGWSDTQQKMFDELVAVLQREFVGE